MNSLQTWTTFFGWLTVVNIGIYLIIVTAILGMRNFAYKMNAKIFGVSEEVVAKAMLRYVANYKLLLTIFCFSPWLALTLMQ